MKRGLPASNPVPDRLHTLLNTPIADQKPHENAKRLRKAIKEARSIGTAKSADSIDAREPDEEPAKTSLDKDDAEVQSRTVFIGNIPKNIKSGRRLLDRLNVPLADIESCRIRSIPVHEKFRTQVLAGVARGAYAAGAYSSNAYVVFKPDHKRSSVGRLLDQNGTELDLHTLRVQRLGGTDKFSKFDRKKTVFVGGLPYSINEDQLRSHFASKIDVVAVRLIRDPTSHEAKGFGFVLLRERTDVRKCIEVFHGAKYKLEVGKKNRKKEIEQRSNRGRPAQTEKKEKPNIFYIQQRQKRQKRISESIKGRKKNKKGS